MKKIISFILIAVVAIGCYKIYTEKIASEAEFLSKSGSDEERIEDTIEKYVKSYNEGDFDSLVKCCTGRYKNDLNAQMGLGSSVLSGIISKLTSGFINLGDNGLKNLWSMGTAYAGIDMEVQKISFISENEAEVKAIFFEKDWNRETTVYLLMQKEKEIWYVASDFYQYSKV
ncbi:MAG: hypothetical protein ACI4IX_03495 [Acutalibacteraceae bacterium]